MYQWSELDYLIYNDPVAYANLILNDAPDLYLKTVTKKTPLDCQRESARKSILKDTLLVDFCIPNKTFGI